MRGTLMKIFITTLLSLQFCLITGAEAKKTNGKNTNKIQSHHNVSALHRSMDLKDLSQSAGIVFKGSLISKSESVHNNIPVTLYKFKIEDGIKGIKNGQKLITLKVWSAIKSPLREIKKNEEHVLFFAQPSILGVTSSYDNQGIVNFNNKQPILQTRTGFKKSELNKTGLKASLSSINSVSAKENSITSYEDLKKICLEFISEGNQ